MNNEQEEVLVGILHQTGIPGPRGKQGPPGEPGGIIQYHAGTDITIDENYNISVNKVDEVGDFTQPITARAVNTTVGNINALLELI